MSDRSFLEQLRNLLTYGKLTEFDKTAFESYRRHQFSFQIGGSAGADSLQSQPEKNFQGVGDHLTVTYVGGALPVYVRLGGDENPFIRMREGLVIKRDTRRLTVRIGNPRANLAGVLAFGMVEFYTSIGPLMDIPPHHNGVSREMLAEEFTISGLTAIADLVTAVGGVGTLPQGYAPTVGKFGGLIVIKNTDLSNKLYLRQGRTFLVAGWAGSNGFPISPGESLSLELDDVFLTANPQQGWSTPTLNVLAGTCKVALLLSSIEVDASAIEQTLNADGKLI